MVRKNQKIQIGLNLIDLVRFFASIEKIVETSHNIYKILIFLLNQSSLIFCSRCVMILIALFNEELPAHSEVYLSVMANYKVGRRKFFFLKILEPHEGKMFSAFIAVMCRA